MKKPEIKKKTNQGAQGQEHVRDDESEVSVGALSCSTSLAGQLDILRKSSMSDKEKVEAVKTFERADWKRINSKVQ